MKKAFLWVIVLTAAALPLGAQEGADKSLNAMSLNGATGIYVVPTARIGFDGGSMGFNAGYHTNIFKSSGDMEMNHLVQANLSILRMIEVSGTFDLQPKVTGDKPNDLILGAKIQLPFGSVPIALGGNVQYHDVGRDYGGHWAFQFYGAVTYQAELFGWPAETSLMAGHTVLENISQSNIDFGVGFDLVIAPKYLGSFLHLLVDYANFSYSARPWGTDAWYRGTLNTGLRIDLSQIPALSGLTFAVDAYAADAFDDRSLGGDGRSFGFGITLGKRF